MHKNVEIKARCDDLEPLRRKLRRCGALKAGTDHQNDTYFHASKGRLKLREGNIERALIHYERPDQAGPKTAGVHLLQLSPEQCSPLRDLLGRALGRTHQVIKKREIYFRDNVKIHLDQVEGLGLFVEIEAIDEAGTLTVEHLTGQCREMMEALGIDPKDLLTHSYSDMLAGS
jgi:predicted adenylyl cyclase CyaB